MKLHLDMYDTLIKAGLVKAKVDTDTNRVIIKYARKVFYNNLWLEHPLLVEARGHVFDAVTGDLLVAPPTKVFNLHENGTTVDPTHLVDVVRKVNGFLACVTFIDGEMVVSTTGSLNSPFVDLARKHLEKLDWDAIGKPEGQTFHFEICDLSDPHITAEIPGAYLIGQRAHSDLSSAMEFHLDDTAYQLKAMRPGWWSCSFGKVLETLQDVKHEGFMIRHGITSETLLKLKSPHYLAKKFIMRMGAAKVDQMFNDTDEFAKKFDEEFYSIIRWIVRWKSQDVWTAYTDQERRNIIEGYFMDRQS